ncbi:unnamed protein product [Bemisia tabaci]|uniref:Guanine nucleotide exchange factor DBS n=1 Tax=Bemisia tabaci TaxID=7038 RepID=A0A9P0F1V2_BEMTA|nr:unnamed protein product [Bemisia tabaci]
METQIENFLEQFKLSSARAMEEFEMKRSSTLGLSLTGLSGTGDGTSTSESESTMSCDQEKVLASDITSLLDQQFITLTGGRSRDGYPIITFPANPNFVNLSNADYQKLIIYITSVPSMQEADMGFAIVVDRRNDKWTSVKAVLSKISAFFPGLIHSVYVLRLEGIFQKTFSKISNKFSRDEFKFQVIVCSCLEELYEHIEPCELTPDLGGDLEYHHEQWLQQRVELEHFAIKTKAVSDSLGAFTRSIKEACEENEVNEEMLLSQETEYATLKDEILRAAQEGEALLSGIKKRENSHCHEPSSFSNRAAIERKLVQLEETERTFDEFWGYHASRLKQCLELKAFENDFRQMQARLDENLKILTESTDIGETVNHVLSLIKDFDDFQQICFDDIERCQYTISRGRGLRIASVEANCDELQRLVKTLDDRLHHRRELLYKAKELMVIIEQANSWCSQGVSLLAAQQLDECSRSPESAENCLAALEEFMDSGKKFCSSDSQDSTLAFELYVTPETKPLVNQVVQRITDVTMMCEKKLASLKKLIIRPPKPVQHVIPEPVITSHKLQNRLSLNEKRLSLNEKLDNGDNTISGTEVDGSLRTMQGHVLNELINTERVYVRELGQIVQGYIHAMYVDDMTSLVPVALEGKEKILFGNLEEIYQFHSNTFLQDLENCLSNPELIAVCFTHRQDVFDKLYSFYCQNSVRSEQLRCVIGESNAFFLECQRRLGHRLPLAAYLLKPIQRITKYQLLLKDLLRYSQNERGRAELQQALECMLDVLRCVNDSMHQIAITGFYGNILELGNLLLQGSFSVSTENKKDRLKELRLKPMQRHLFLYENAILFCKKTTSDNKDMYHFKRLLKMSQIGLTETVKGDPRKFELWLQARQEVYTIQAANVEQKSAWVKQIQKLLFDQLFAIKGEKNRQYSVASGPAQHIPVRQSVSLDSGDNCALLGINSNKNHVNDNNVGDDENAWSSDGSISDNDESFAGPRNNVLSGRFMALADYCAIGPSAISLKEGDCVEILKVGSAGWLYVKSIGSQMEGWAPSSYLEQCGRKSSRSCQSVSSQVSSSTD